MWHLDEIVALLEARVVGPFAAASNTPSRVTGISIDSRSALPGELFLALAGDPGPRFHTSSPGSRDGHDFVAAAAAAGVSAAIVERAVAADVLQLQVADTLDALWALGAGARARLAATTPVFAVTGSSGKTTAKGFLAAASGAFASAGSLNNFWGVPLSLARTPQRQVLRCTKSAPTHRARSDRSPSWCNRPWRCF